MSGCIIHKQAYTCVYVWMCYAYASLHLCVYQDVLYIRKLTPVYMSGCIIYICKLTHVCMSGCVIHTQAYMCVHVWMCYAYASLHLNVCPCVYLDVMFFVLCIYWPYSNVILCTNELLGNVEGLTGLLFLSGGESIPTFHHSTAPAKPQHRHVKGHHPVLERKTSWHHVERSRLYAMLKDHGFTPTRRNCGSEHVEMDNCVRIGL